MPCDQSLSIDRVAELEALGYLQDVVDDSYGQYTDPKDLIKLYELLSLNDGQLTQEQALEKGLEMETRFGMLPGLVIFIVDRLDSLGRHREATEFLVRANSENPARFTEELRIRKKQSGEKYALAQTIRDTLRATPTHPTALYDLAVTLAWLEEWEESEAMLIKVLAASPQDETARLQLAGVQGARGNTEQALATLDAGRNGEYSAALDCQSARILYRYLDRKTEAKRRLRRCEERGGTLQAADLRVLSSP
jgi:tetratricopeptide (TPR) repeat protein